MTRAAECRKPTTVPTEALARRPRAIRAGPPSSPAIAAPTAASSTPSRRPASSAARPAARARRGPRTWRSTRRPPTRSARAFAPAGAASRISARSPRRTRRRSPSSAASSSGAESAPTLRELSSRAGLSAHHLHRVFKAITGLTPKAYAAAHRARRVRDELGRSGTVTEAIYGAGYSSSGRFYAESNRMLGMTPSRYRAGGAETPIRFAVGECSLGSILVARSERGVCAILLGRRSGCARARAPGSLPARGADRRRRATSRRSWPGSWDSSSRRRSASIFPSTSGAPPSSSASGRRLVAIPAGETASYAEIARRIGAPRSVRAVAQACGANALAVAIPCHRVVRNDGALSGYRWGVERKRALLERERGKGAGEVIEARIEASRLEAGRGRSRRAGTRRDRATSSPPPTARASSRSTPTTLASGAGS